jgi:hypothetical protein
MNGFDWRGPQRWRKFAPTRLWLQPVTIFQHQRQSEIMR